MKNIICHWYELYQMKNTFLTQLNVTIKCEKARKYKTSEKTKFFDFLVLKLTIFGGELILRVNCTEVFTSLSQKLIFWLISEKNLHHWLLWILLFFLHAAPLSLSFDFIFFFVCVCESRFRAKERKREKHAPTTGGCVPLGPRTMSHHWNPLGPKS